MKSNSLSPYSNQTKKAADENSDIKKLVSDFIALWPFVLALLLINLLAAYFVSKTTVPTYPVKATMVIKQDKNPVSSELFESIGLKPINNLENEIGILNSFTLAYNTLNQLDFNIEYYRDGFWQEREVYHQLPYELEVDWSHNQLVDAQLDIKMLDASNYSLAIKGGTFKLLKPLEPEKKFSINKVPKIEGTYKIGSWIEGINYRFRIVRSNDSSAKVSEFSFRLQSNYSLAVQYSKRLKVDISKKESTILALSLETSMVEKGRLYLNKIIETYQVRELNNKNRTATNTAAFINDQLKSIKDSLVFFEDKLQRYRSRSNSFNLEQQSTLVLGRLSDLEEQRANASLKIKYYQSALSYLNTDQINSLVVPSTVGIQEPGVDQLINELITIQNDRLRLNQFLSNDNKTLRDLNFKYTTVLNSLKENISRAYKTATLALSDLNRRIAELNGQLTSMPQVERDMLSIKRQSSISENIYTYLLQKRDEAEISRASNIPSSEVLDLARQAGEMITPQPSKNYAIAISLAFIIPLCFIFIRNIFDSKIYEVKALENTLTVPLLGTIGRSARKGFNNVVFDAPKAFVSENFRSIRASTQFLHPADQTLVIAFTSSVSNEGKTFCSINTAAIYALGGKKTVLVGLDLRRPKIAKDFGLDNNFGVSNFLSTNIEVDSIVKKSAFENLDILLSGPIPPNPAELIGNSRFPELISALRAKYDVIILDCPPAGLVSETIDIFRQSDLNFYIFRHMFSDWESVGNLNDLIDKGLIRKAYAIYNDVPVSAKYGYGYGYHYHEDSAEQTMLQRLKRKLLQFGNKDSV